MCARPSNAHAASSAMRATSYEATGGASDPATPRGFTPSTRNEDSSAGTCRAKAATSVPKPGSSTTGSPCPVAGTSSATPGCHFDAVLASRRPGVDVLARDAAARPTARHPREIDAEFARASARRGSGRLASAGAAIGVLRRGRSARRCGCARARRFGVIVRDAERLGVEGFVRRLGDRAEQRSAGHRRVHRDVDVPQEAARVASISTSAFSDSITSTICPRATAAPSGSGHATTRPSCIVMPSFGIAIGVATRRLPISRTAAITFSALGRKASSRTAANGTGVCGAVTRFTGAFRKSKPRSTHSAATSLAIPQRGVDSSTTTRRPVFSSEPRMAASSSGWSERRSSTSASVPSLRELLGGRERHRNRRAECDECHVAACAHHLAPARSARS